ncbi:MULTISPECIES: glycosyltransferase family 2 protein [Methanobacterium]|uniref:Glycosyl transferase family 2 n=1 Tax=Methanobacterium bryantii TaxID=2161 RepID=A0A2A2H4D8_METBR|nr:MULTISPECIES: glycosyltransferase family 2 protein [Methanobacterium]OEC84687.1 glycosyl transferase family 2 [Methanobacterium sp. A39]PAV04279.1 glycosyl transferase family 2 [Methanobacterium bryantii]
MNEPKVAIVILDWNGWEDTIECLESLYQIRYSNYYVILVDNNSSNESILKIKDYCNGKVNIKSKFFEYNKENKPIGIIEYSKEESESKASEKGLTQNNDHLILIKNDKNYGFAEGNNIGMRYALKTLNADYVLLLNNDTVVDKDFLGKMVNFGEINKNNGIIGPKIYYYDQPNTIWCIGGKIDWKLARGLHIGTNEVDNGQYDKTEEFNYVSGSAFLIKREVMDKIGLMDKKFFLYFEETDLALRASKNGYKSVYAPGAKIWHKVSKSGGGLSKPIGLYYITRNRWLFMKKWAKKSDYAFFIIYQVIGAVVFPVVLSIYYRNWKLFQAYYDGLIKGLGN